MLADTIFRLVPKNNETINRRYLWAVLSSAAMRPAIQALATGAATMPNISKARLKCISIPVPPPEAQQAFAQRLEEVRSIVARQSRMAETAEATMQALMATCFSS